jgi:hypothetical protein
MIVPKSPIEPRTYSLGEVALANASFGREPLSGVIKVGDRYISDPTPRPAEGPPSQS